MVKRRAIERKKTGIKWCSNFLMRQTAVQITKRFRWTRYNFRDCEKLQEEELISGKYERNGTNHQRSS